ncbi:hypothetical protein AK812_SmicGene45125 [Symbiodinium microadriaticum]|uniref:Secreted protein n=1 Tax=Symbiodinium microadriaticum TaxID=2951 RepID=A0A1Q9BWQ0_SYMMI|nr:hypothetical protein AK812_SmicGene45125 [Symbiodinium microadriaticum]
MRILWLHLCDMISMLFAKADRWADPTRFVVAAVKQTSSIRYSNVAAPVKIVMQKVWALQLHREISRCRLCADAITLSALTSVLA